MTALIRTLMQVVIARILATPIGEWAYPLLADLNITEERLADYGTIVVLGLGVGAAKVLKSTDIGAKTVEWVNLILSWGRSAAGPEYQAKHLRTE